MAVLSSNGTDLPAPVSIKINDELIWSSNAGRVASGRMIGDLIAQKTTLSIEWAMITASQANTITGVLSGAFVPVTYKDLGITFTKTFYKGSTGDREPIGTIGGVEYYKSFSLELVEQ